MLEICANRLLPEALKTCLKSNKLPNLVTLFTCFLLVKCCRAAASAAEEEDKEVSPVLFIKSRHHLSS